MQIVLQPSPLSNFGILSSFKKETLYPKIVMIFSLPPSLATTNPISLPVNLPILDISYKWNHVICGILNQNFFTEHSIFIPRAMEWRGRWEEGSGWGDTYAPVADSCLCTAKTITIS